MIKKKIFLIDALLQVFKTTRNEILPIVDNFTDADGKYPFELFYEDGSRSWMPVLHKKPWGVIVGDSAIRLRSSPKCYNWDEAQLYCRKICINGKVASCGSFVSWKKIAGLSPDSFLALNRFLVFLKGDRLDQLTFWTASSDGFFRAFSVKLGENAIFTDVSKTFSFLTVRPFIEGV